MVSHLTQISRLDVPRQSQRCQMTTQNLSRVAIFNYCLVSKTGIRIDCSRLVQVKTSPKASHCHVTRYLGQDLGGAIVESMSSPQTNMKQMLNLNIQALSICANFGDGKSSSWRYAKVSLPPASLTKLTKSPILDFDIERCFPPREAEVKLDGAVSRLRSAAFRLAALSHPHCDPFCRYQYLFLRSNTYILGAHHTLHNITLRSNCNHTYTK